MKKLWIILAVFAASLGLAVYLFGEGGTGIGELHTTYKQAATPATPGATYDRLYFKSDDNLYRLTSGGLEGIVGTGCLTLPLSIANGGTSSTAAANARTALGLGTMATQAASNVTITGGSVNATTLGVGAANVIMYHCVGGVSDGILCWGNGCSCAAGNLVATSFHTD